VATKMLEQDILNMLNKGNTDLGGGPGYDDARALSQLIMGGGSAAIGGTQLFGQPVNNDLAAELQLGPGTLFDVNGKPMPLPVNQTKSNPAPVPVNSNLKSVLDTADQIAGSLGSPHASGAPITSTLLPNPHGPGSYNPNDPAAVAAVQKAGQEAAKAESASRFIKLLQGEAPTMNPYVSTDPAQAAKDMAVYQQKSKDYEAKLGSSKDIVKNILEGLGIGETTFAKNFNAAAGKAAGEKAGGKNSELPNDLLKSAGTSSFEEKMAKASADGSINAQQQLALERLHDSRIKQATPDVKSTTTAASIRTSADQLQKIEDAYKKTEAYKTGKISDNVKLALAASSKGNVAVEALPLWSKLTQDERDFISQFNVFGMNLRRVSEDSRFSNFDAQKVIDAVGNPLVGKDQYLSQLGAAKENLQTRHDTFIDALNQAKKDTSGFTRYKQKAAAASSIPTGRVEVIGPDGRVGHIPASQLAEAEKQGYKRK